MLLQIDKLGKVAVTIEKDYWNINKDYDKLTVVEVADKFATYISRIPVPAGTELNNRKYWIPFSSLKEEIVIHYNEWINLFGGLLTSQAEVLNNIQKIINDIYTHLPKGIIFEGDINVYDVGESATIHLICRTTGDKPASEIKLYKNNILIETWHNVTGFEIDETVDSDTEFRVEAIIDGWKYYGSWNVAMVYPFYIGTGTNVEDIIANEDYKHKGSEGLNGIYQVSPNDSDNIFIVAPKWIVIPEATMGGIKIPFDTATEYIIDEIVYYVYKSSNQYQQGHYSIKIGSVEYDKDSLTAELLNKVTDMSDEFANYDDRISEVERISGNREKSSVTPTHMGRVTLKPNVKYPITKGWGIYSYTFDYEGDYTVDVLIYFENDKFYLPYRNVRHPKVINVISQTSYGEQKLDVGDADVNDIATALNITEESQYLFYDDDDFVVTMPDDSKLSIADVIRNNWPLHDYTDFLDVKNLLTQSMINEPNTIYVIQYDFTLDSQTITIPEGCALKFEGGSLSNGTLEGNNTVIISYLTEEKVLINIIKTGTWKPSSDVESRVAELENDMEVLNDKVGTNETDIASLKAIAGNRTPSTVAPKHKGKITLLPNLEDVNLSMTWRYFLNSYDSLKYLVYVNDGTAYLVYNENDNKAVIITALGFDTYTPQNIQNITDVIGNNFLSDFDLGSGIIIPGGTEYSIDDLNELLSDGQITQYTGLTGKVNLLTTDAFPNADTIYIIQDDFTLNGDSITIPNNCTLDFRGGSFNNGRISLNSAKVLPYYNDLLGTNLTVSDMPAAGTLYKRDIRPYLSIHDGISWIDISGFSHVLPSALNRPNNLTFPRDYGFSFFDRTLNKPIWALSENIWIESDGIVAGIKRYGNTNERPASDTLYPGFIYFDRDLGFLITWTGTTWIEQDGSQAGVWRAGNTSHRPASVDIYKGFQYYDTDINAAIVWNGTKWVESDGATAGVKRSGTTSELPTGSDIYIGFKYYSTNLSQFIIWNGQRWIYDANGYTAVNDGAINYLQGSLASKPYALTSNDTGFEYYATDVHKKIIFEYASGGSKWYYSDGTEVTA